MAIIDAEEGAFWPFSTSELLRFRLHNVQDDGYSILIVVPYDTLIGVSTVSSDDTVPFGRVLRRLIVWH